MSGMSDDTGSGDWANIVASVFSAIAAGGAWWAASRANGIAKSADERAKSAEEREKRAEERRHRSIGERTSRELQRVVWCAVGMAEETKARGSFRTTLGPELAASVRRLEAALDGGDFDHLGQMNVGLVHDAIEIASTIEFVATSFIGHPTTNAEEFVRQLDDRARALYDTRSKLRAASGCAGPDPSFDDSVKFTRAAALNAARRDGG